MTHVVGSMMLADDSSTVCLFPFVVMGWNRLCRNAAHHGPTVHPTDDKQAYTNGRIRKCSKKPLTLPLPPARISHEPLDVCRGLKFMHNCALLLKDVWAVSITDPFSSKIRRQQLAWEHQAALSGGTPIIPIRSGDPNSRPQ